MNNQSKQNVKSKCDFYEYQSTNGAAEVASVMTTDSTTTDIWQFRFLLQCSGIFFLHTYTMRERERVLRRWEREEIERRKRKKEKKVKQKERREERKENKIKV